MNGQSFNNLLGSGLLDTSNALTCATSNGSTFGCLTSTDWNTFNGKLGSYDAWTHPFALSSATTSTMYFNTGGLDVTASTTISSTFHLPTLSDGGLAVYS